MTLPGPFANPVLHVVSIDRFLFDNNKKSFAPQPKMLWESESHPKKGDEKNNIELFKTSRKNALNIGKWKK